MFVFAICHSLSFPLSNLCQFVAPYSKSWYLALKFSWFRYLLLFFNVFRCPFYLMFSGWSRTLEASGTEVFVTIVNGCLDFVTESCVSSVAGFQDLISGIAVNDNDQAADMTFTIISHVLVWYRNDCGTDYGTETVLYIWHNIFSVPNL